MPEMIESFRSEWHDGNDPHNPLSLSLILPSVVCHDPSVPAVLLEHEFSLRQAQAYDALADLRDCLEVLKYLEGHMVSTAQPVNGGLSMLASMVHAKIRSVAERYRAAYSALRQLESVLRKGNWQKYLQRLDKEHLQCPPDGPDQLKTHTTPHVRSWIWQLSDTPFGCSHNARNPSVNATLHHGEYLYIFFVSKQRGLIATDVKPCAYSGSRLALA